jgi:hypothetical protein
MLPTNQDYWRNGYVTTRTRDREVSLMKRAGHAIALLGWDDTEVQSRDRWATCSPTRTARR